MGLLVASVLVSVILFTVFMVKMNSNIARRFPELNRSSDRKLPSPYGIEPAQNNEGGFGYCITKNGKVLTLKGSSGFIVYGSYGGAVQEMNRYERLGGYRETKS